jgi:predicted signal transduction protein with EAL and GGDEF domain/FixJ family two-component response regulator
MCNQKLLVIDDSPDVHELVSIWLADQGVEIRFAPDGAHGLSAAAEWSPDLILLDVDMPGIDGFEVCRRLKANPDTRPVPVVFLSGAADTEQRLRGLELGAVDYVAKPFDPTELRARVRSNLAMRQLAARLEESERFARSTVDALTTHIAILDGSGLILATNRAWTDFATANAADPATLSPGANYIDFCLGHSRWLGRHGTQVANGVRAVARGDAPHFQIEYRSDAGGQARWFAARISRFPGDGPVRIVVARENITDLKLAEERLRHDSLHDALTGLPNRVLFADRVERCVERHRRNPAGHAFAVLFLDLDRFKLINDSLGHAAGDHLLRAVADRIQDAIRTTDCVVRHAAAAAATADEPTVARLGGDEFTILLEDLRSPDDAVRVAERVQAVVGQPLTFEGHEISTTASIGIVAGGAGYASATDLLRDADVAMYRAKACGKARYAIFDSAMHEAAVASLRIENDLRRALQGRELELHYQPLVSLNTGVTVGFEALIRWRHAGKLISPAHFIPIAEETGLIVPIGSWVIRCAVEQLARWRAGSTAAPDLCVSVNLSRRQLSDPTLVPHIEDCLRRNNVPPHLLKVEITESMIMEDRGTAADILNRLKSTGVVICIDDFGTGHSSLSCLHEFPIDVLKVDRSFVSGAHANRNRSDVLRAILALARNLGLQTIAEGIETPDQRAFLLTHGCEFGQGYLFSPAVPADEAIRTVPAIRQISA